MVALAILMAKVAGWPAPVRLIVVGLVDSVGVVWALSCRTNNKLNAVNPIKIVNISIRFITYLITL